MKVFEVSTTAVTLYVKRCCVLVVCSLVRGPGIFGEVTVSWNITPPHQKEFAEISGTLTMRDRQSAAVVLIQV